MKAVLFDMDGVIVNSEHFWPEIEENQVFPQVVENSFNPIDQKGLGIRDLYYAVAEQNEMAVDVEEFFEIYHEAAEDLYRKQVSLMDGFHELIEELKNRDIKRGLVTSSLPEWVDLVVQRFELEDAFEETVSSEEIDRASKPEPHIYLRGAELLGVDASSCTAVEDSPRGIASAKSAGMVCIAYRSGSNRDEDLSRADDVVDSPDELRRRLLFS